MSNTNINYVEKETGVILEKEYDSPFVLPIGCVKEIQDIEYVIDSMTFEPFNRSSDEPHEIGSKLIANLYLIKKENV